MTITNSNIYKVPEIIPTATQISLNGHNRNNKEKKYVLSDRSVCLLGSPGCGKTSTILRILDDLSKNPMAVTVILDMKRDFVKKAFRPGDVVLSLFDIDGVPKDSQVKWSLLNEAYNDTHPEIILYEIASMIYQSAVEGSENKAFPISAKFIFYAILFITYKESNGKMPSNKELIHKAETITPSKLLEDIEKYDELASVRNLVTEKQNVTSWGIQMEKARVLADLFVKKSNFCHENSDFSIRDFIHRGKGHRLIIVLDIESRSSSENIAKLLLDIALKEALSGDDLEYSDMTRYYFVLDEYAYLPCGGLEYLDFAKDMGRSKGLRIIGAFQHFSQLKKLYGGKLENAMNDAAGYGDIVVFHPHDGATRDFVLNRCGTEMKETVTIDAMCNVHTEVKEMPVVPPGVLNELKCGEAVILPDEGRPFWFYFDE